MKQFRLFLSIALIGIVVAITYFLFEHAVHESIHFIWTVWLPSDEVRWLVVPLTFILSLAYFGSQHYLDANSEQKQAEGFSELPTPTIKNFLKILFIGYFSLVAGASLGPEAVLVPACLCIGALLGKKLLGKNKQLINLATTAGFIALFTAFFHSAIIGVLSLFLLLKETKSKLQPMLVAVTILSALTAWLTLNFLDERAYVELPIYNWNLHLSGLFISIVLILSGYASVWLMDKLHAHFQFGSRLRKLEWWQTALLAAMGLSVLYLLGGNLVGFTGNQAIVPLFEQAAQLGTIGLIWILVVKIAAISWSKALGYRGGVIFPTIFAASVLVAITQQIAPSYNLIYGLIAVLLGAFIANGKNHILM